MLKDTISIKSLRGPGGLINLGKDYKLEFDIHGISTCPKSQEKFWKHWEGYGKEILTLDDYMKIEADKKIKEIKDMVKMYAEKMPDPKKFLKEVANAIEENPRKENPKNEKGEIVIGRKMDEKYESIEGEK